MKTAEKMKKRIIISVTFLILGIVIYYIFGNGLLNKNDAIKLLIRNYLPDICWTCSFFFMSINFTKHITKNDLIINSIYVIAIAFCYELLQLFGIAKGIFDIIDLIIYVLSVLFCSRIEALLRRKNI